MKKIIMASFLIIVLLSGCSKKAQTDYPSVVAWNNLNYGISAEEVSKENLAKQLGAVKRLKKPMPLENGDANFVSVGSKIFEIKGIDVNDAIAIEEGGKITKAIKNGSLK